MPDTSNGLDATHSQGRWEDDDLPTVEEILLREAHEWQQMGSSDGHVTGGPGGDLARTAENDRDRVAGPRSSESEHKGRQLHVLPETILTADREVGSSGCQSCRGLQYPRHSASSRWQYWLLYEQRFDRR